MGGENKGCTKHKINRIKDFPISFLAVALGLMGFTLAWQKAEAIFSIPFEVSMYLFYFSTAVFALISAIYLLKVVFYPEDAKKEFNHPIKLNFYPIIAKVLLIMSIILLSIDLEASKWLWWAGVVVQFAFTIIILGAWIQQTKFEKQHINPAWFIPVVGCLIIPIAGVVHFSSELSWFFFSIGIFWWMILTTIIINRVIFHHPVPDKLLPTFFILFAPPVIGFIALTKLLGEINPFGNILYYFGLFLFVLIIFQYRMFVRIKFYLSWWAYSFPLAALAIGTFLMYHESGAAFFGMAFGAIFVLLNIIILVLLAKTLSAIKNKRICVEED